MNNIDKYQWGVTLHENHSPTMTQDLQELSNKYSKIPNHPDYHGLIQCLKENRDWLLQRPDVNAVSIGYKTINGVETEQLVLVIKVGKKRLENQLTQDELLPKEINGYETDITEGYARRH